MVHDALQHVEQDSMPRDETWMKHLKEAAATAFLGVLFAHSHGLSTHSRF